MRNVERNLTSLQSCSIFTWLNQLVFQASPIVAKQICARETAVASDTNNVVDGVLDKICRGFKSTFTFLELRASRTAYNGATLTDNGNRFASKSLIHWQSITKSSLFIFFIKIFNKQHLVIVSNSNGLWTVFKYRDLLLYEIDIK